jgi:hypothetical protein
MFCFAAVNSHPLFYFVATMRTGILPLHTGLSGNVCYATFPAAGKFFVHPANCLLNSRGKTFEFNCTKSGGSILIFSIVSHDGV